MLSRRNACCCVLAFVVFSGCTPAEVKKLSKKSKVVTWEELQALQDPEIQMALVVNAQRGNFAELKKAAASPKLGPLVDAFEGSTIPPEFASPAREKVKERVVKEYKNVIAMGKGVGSGPELKGAVLALAKSLSELTDPDLK